MLKFIIWHICLDSKKRFSNKYMTVFSCQSVCPSGGCLLLSFLKATALTSCLCLCLVTLCFFSHISGVKRGVCSQINHFPEDADFDHDGAEYVLRKLTAALLGMDDEWERRRKHLPFITTFRYFLNLVFLLLAPLKTPSARNKHVTMCAENQGRWGALVRTSALQWYLSALWYATCVPVHT